MMRSELFRHVEDEPDVIADFLTKHNPNRANIYSGHT